MSVENLLEWFDNSARPFLQKHAPERLASLENDHARLKRLLGLPDKVTVCFLGNSGIGKSTLLNALAAGGDHVLPAGGIGPLTAQATEVHYSQTPMFRVTYHQRKHLWKVAFALERRHENELRKAGLANKLPGPVQGGDTSSELDENLDEEDREDATAAAELVTFAEGESGDEGRASEAIEQIVKQAKLIVTGDQFSKVSLPYLVDALRVACDVKPRWQQSIHEHDARRLARVRQVLKLPKDRRIHENRQGDGRSAFMSDLKDHAAGYLAPLIERIEVGWPSDVLRSGVALVDSPGLVLHKMHTGTSRRSMCGSRLARSFLWWIAPAQPTRRLKSFVAAVTGTD
ncbi:MAG: dynamin family protein [Pseudomonadota bacterium]